MERCSVRLMLALGSAVLAGTAAVAGAHTWDVNEVFSNADGTIQFIELREAGGGAGETFVGGHPVTSNSRSVTITNNVAPPTSFRHILFGTPAFSALAGAPPVDYVLPSNFLSTVADTITYVPYDAMTYALGQLPTDGIHSLNDPAVVAINSPTNYAGQTGAVNVSFPGVPDGSAGSTPMTAEKLSSTGGRLSVSWDTTSCTGAANHQIIWGQRTNLPTAPGGSFTVGGGVCAIGTTSPYGWNGVPDATDGSGLIWWLILVTDGLTEGSWGDGTAGERTGPAAGGSSGVCGVTGRDLSDTCGH